MKTIVTGEEMKLLDDNISKVYGVPSVILMEQAAMGVVRELVASFSKETKFLVVCGKGNNAGDGIAIARLLNQNGMQASVFFCSDKDEGSSELFLLQKKIYKNYAYPVENEIKKGYDVIIDAVFGTGLSRGISGRYLKVIEDINRHDALKAAIDIASGIHAGSGKVCPRWIAGSSRLHTLAASMMPAAMPHRMRCVQGRDCRRSKNTPAAPSVVHAAGNSSTHAVKTIWFTIHSPFARCMCAEAKRCRKARHTKYSVTGFSVRMRWHLLRCQSHSPAP